MRYFSSRASVRSKCTVLDAGFDRDFPSRSVWRLQAGDGPAVPHAQHASEWSAKVQVWPSQLKSDSSVGACGHGARRMAHSLCENEVWVSSPISKAY
jgi:hypothetical protein